MKFKLSVLALYCDKTPILHIFGAIIVRETLRNVGIIFSCL